MKRIFLMIMAAVLLGSSALADTPEPGLLRTAVSYNISTMDVALTTDDYLIPMNVFDRLFETRPGEGGSSEVVKSLVTDYSVSADGLTYSFTLQEGVVFSNGSPLTASDVQFSFERLLKTAKQNTEIPEEVAGGTALLQGKAETLEGFHVVDDTHFTVTLEAPNAGFIAELSAPAMSVVDAETMANAPGFGMKPEDTIGSGPYIVTEWDQEHYTLVYNEKYRGPEPSVKKLIVSVIPDENTRNLKFQHGELDMLDLAGLDSLIVAATYKSNPKYRIVGTPKVGMTYLMMNENNEYLKDVRVRRAIGMAIDVDLIIASFFNGDAVRENGVIPTGVWGHNDELEGFAYDPDGARKLLQEAGYRENEIHFEMAFNTSESSTLRNVYDSISLQLEKIGIRAEVKNREKSAWTALRNSGEMDSFVARWGMDYNDPANIMYTFFGSAENTRGRSLNYADGAVIERVSKARSIVDDEERKAEYQALEKKLIQEDAAWIPMYAEMHLYCLGDRVESFTPQWAGFTDFYAADVVLK